MSKNLDKAFNIYDITPRAKKVKKSKNGNNGSKQEQILSSGSNIDLI